MVAVLPRRRADGRGAAAGAEPHARELRPRHRGAGRVRRPRRRPGREPDLRRQQRGLPRSPRAHGHRHAGAGEGRGGALARRAALHDGGPAVPEARPGRDDAGPQGRAAARRRAGGELPRRPADDAEERPVGRPARAARDADRQRRARRRCRLRRGRTGQGRPRRARAQPARRRHVDARRLPRGRRARRARRPPHDAQLARPVVRAAAGAAGEPRALAAAHGRRGAEPGVPGRSGRAREAPADLADRPGEGRSADGGAADRCRGCSTARRTPTPTRSPGPATNRRSSRSPATICCAGTGRGSRRTGAR